VDSANMNEWMNDNIYSWNQHHCHHKKWYLCVLVLCTQVNMMFVMLLWVCIHTGQAES
jgi:hypothetical protein